MSSYTRVRKSASADSACGCGTAVPLRERGALSTKLTAIYLGEAEGTLKNRRSLGITDPPFVRTGRSVVYRVADLDDYLERHRVGGDRRLAASTSG